MAEQSVLRKLTAILAADVVGYSRLMGADEDGTLARLKEIRRKIVEPRVALYGGRIVKTMGDGLLIEYGSAIAAVSCALDIQAEMASAEAPVTEDRRVCLRIGINTGDVIHENGDVFGDGVNVAARLEQMANPGGICVSRNVFDQVRDRLAIEHEYMGEQPVKNISRPIEVYRLTLASSYVVAPLPVRHMRHSRPIAIGSAALVVLLVLAVTALIFWPSGYVSAPPSQPSHAAGSVGSARQMPRLSIAVLPFTNLSGDTQQDYFADGLTEDLITDLSRISGSFVIARNTTFAYKGKAVDVRKVGVELGVRYVLEGSVRRSGDRVRVNAQLIAVETAAHVWAERFDREYKDAFALQSEITGRIARTLNLELIEAENRRAQRMAPAQLEANDLALQGWVTLLNKPQTTETNSEAAGPIGKALTLDPNSALAWTALTYIHTRAGNFGWSASRSESLKNAIEAGERAVQLDPRSSDAIYMLGYALRSSGQLERSIAAMERSIALNPNNPLPYHGLAYGSILMGHAEKAPPLLDHAFRLSPREPLAAIWYWTAAQAQLLTGNDAEAIVSAEKAIGINPRFPRSYLVLAAAAANLEKEAEARAAVAEYLKHSHSLKTVSEVLEYWMSLSANPNYRAQLERFGVSLRKAGLPA